MLRKGKTERTSTLYNKNRFINYDSQINAFSNKACCVQTSQYNDRAFSANSRVVCD